MSMPGTRSARKNRTTCGRNWRSSRAVARDGHRSTCHLDRHAAADAVGCKRSKPEFTRQASDFTWRCSRAAAGILPPAGAAGNGAPTKVENSGFNAQPGFSVPADFAVVATTKTVFTSHGGGKMQWAAARHSVGGEEDDVMDDPACPSATRSE